MKRKIRSESARFFSVACFALISLVLTSLLLYPGTISRAREKDEVKEKPIGKSWAERRTKLRKALPNPTDNLNDRMRARLRKFRIVRRPQTELSGYQSAPSLWEAMSAFYGFIEKRELDVYEEQEGIPDHFPDRGAYYDFLDTVLPAMRDRRFERNRILGYRIHEISPVADEPDKVNVLISVTSDDIFPFGKLMVCTHQWFRSSFGWYPGKVYAEPATYWERIR